MSLAAKYSRTYTARHPGRRSASLRAFKLREYGVSVVWYLAQFQHQDGRCAICRQATPGKHLYVDHNHASGAVRGLLCQKCNSVLGMAGDSRQVLQAAADYLEQHQ